MVEADVGVAPVQPHAGHDYLRRDVRFARAGLVGYLELKGLAPMEQELNVKGAAAPRHPAGDEEEPKITSVSETQIYNAECINADTVKGRITPAGLQRLNNQFGTRVVSSALASVRLGSTSVDKPYAYLARVCAIRYIEVWNRACAEPFVDPRTKRTHRGGAVAALVDATPYREAGMTLWKRFSWPELGRIAGVPPETARRVTLGIVRSVRQPTADRLEAWVERARKSA